MTLSATYSEENDRILSGLDIPEIYPGLYIPGVSNDGFIKQGGKNCAPLIVVAYPGKGAGGPVPHF